MKTIILLIITFQILLSNTKQIIPNTFTLEEEKVNTIYQFAKKYYKYLTKKEKEKIGNSITSFSEYIINNNNMINIYNIAQNDKIKVFKDNNKITLKEQKEINYILKKIRNNKNKRKFYMTKREKKDLYKQLIQDLKITYKKDNKTAILIVSSLFEANKYIWGEYNLKNRILTSYNQLKIESDFRNKEIRNDKYEHSIGLGQIRVKTLKSDIVPLLEKMNVKDNVILSIMKENIKIYNKKELENYLKNIQINIYAQTLVHKIKSNYKNVKRTHKKSEYVLHKMIKSNNLSYLFNFIRNNKQNTEIINILTAYNGYNIIKNKTYSLKMIKSLNNILKRLNV